MEMENLALKEFVKENLRKGYIQLSQLLVGYLVLFILKKNEKLRICINYKQLNSISVLHKRAATPSEPPPQSTFCDASPFNYNGSTI